MNSPVTGSAVSPVTGSAVSPVPSVANSANGSAPVPTGTSPSLPANAGTVSSIFDGSSSLSSDPVSIGHSSAMAIDSSPSMVASVLGDSHHETIDPDVALGSALTDLKAELNQHIQSWAAARSRGDVQAADRALQQLEQTKRAIKSFDDCRKALSSVSGSSKFQLSTHLMRYFPNDEVYESVEQFLKTFERIVNPATGNNIEKYWKQIIPLTLPPGDDTWIENSLLTCKTWKEAKEEFRRHHESPSTTNRFVELVFTMQMKHRDSLVDYSRRFLQAMFNAGIPRDDQRAAQRFLASLSSDVQPFVRMSMNNVDAAKGQAQDWTVETITDVGRKILGDNPAAYRSIAAMMPGHNADGRFEGSASLGAAVNSGKHKKKGSVHMKAKVHKETVLFCKHHGRNYTHGTADCFFLNKKTKGDMSTSTKAVNKCRRCGEPWSREHKCRKSTSDGHVLTVSEPDSEEIAKMEKELGLQNENQPHIPNEDVVMDENNSDSAYD